MRHRPWRALPAVLLLFALAVAAFAPAHRVAADSQLVPCTGAPIALPPTDGCLMGGGGHLFQPIVLTTNAALCSLRVSSGENWATASVSEWDPVTLAPDPTTASLRSFAFGPSDLQYGHCALSFYRPLVGRRLAHIAEPPRNTIAVQYNDRDGLPFPGYPQQVVYFQGDADPSLPLALQQVADGAPIVPLPGAHAVLSYGLCDGDAATQALVLAQSVRTTDSAIDLDRDAIMQRFRVPADVQVAWFEVDFPSNLGWTSGQPMPEISVFESTGDVPPDANAVGLAHSGWTFPPNGQWVPNDDFDQPPVLHAGHDYWLMVHLWNRYRVATRTITGTESSDFLDEIGPLYSRSWATAPGWTLEPQKSLAFRLVATPVGVTSTPPESPPATIAFRLRAAPNPARGATFVNWAGASGALRIEVLDARGRRVASGGAAGGASGRWRFEGLGDAGRPLPAGLYFVRARDAGGHAAIERVTLVK